LKYGIDHINKIIQGSVLQFLRNDNIEYLLTDSRKLIFPDTSLFFALHSARRDGHQYIKELYERGVRNFVIDKEIPVDEYKDANITLVANTLKSLQQLASFHRRQFNIPVIGITGSNGKTIVKEWLNQLLEDQLNIVRSPRSYNSQIGVPLSVWQMNDAHELGIFEAGISRPAEMDKLEKVIQPTIGIFTNIGEAHSEGFKNIGKKIEEKITLFDHSAVVIYRGDNRQIAEALHAWKKKHGQSADLFDWGNDSNAKLIIKRVEGTTQGTTLLVSYNNEDFSISIPFADVASIENAIHCICVLLYLGIPIVAIQNKLQRLSAIAMRLELKEAINHCSVINDSYSADLSSLKIALDFLSQQQQHARLTVILSDILQSGKEEKVLYKEVAQLLQQKKINRLIAIGERITANKALFETLKGETVFYASTDEFIQHFNPLHFRDETILIKGARVFQFEKIDRLLARQVHQTVLEIDLNAMAHNLKQYQQVLQPATKLMAMVKAFAYGTGSYEIANLLQFHKIDYLGVAYADEGVELRKAGINIPIMVMNTGENGFDALIQYNLEPVIYSFRLLKSIDQYLKKEGILQFPVHIEIETGMNRLGFPVKDIPELIACLQKAPFKIQSVFSHLAASEEPQQDAFTRQQADLFLHAASQVQDALPYPFLKHIANSAAIIRYPELQLNMVRLGIGLYGVDSAASNKLDLKEVATLKSTIAQIKNLEENETVGYNRKGVATRDLTIATIRIGYADGYPRSLGNGAGRMLVKGHLANTIGSICMDMTMIDITGIPAVQEGDEVLVFGKELSVQQTAHWAQTIPYEILTGVSQRVKRIYFEE
jgi:alanine racemase